MNNTLLYSSNELSMLRANKQAQRRLDVTCQQIDVQKTYINNDWNNRIKAFLSQKKKAMPKGWDHTKYRPPSGWSRPPRTFNSGALSGEYGAPILQSPKVPRTWKLRASYIKLTDGRMIPQTLHKTDNRIDVGKHRRVVSAPLSRRTMTPRPPSGGAPKSFLVTQLEIEDELFYDSHESSISDVNLGSYVPRPLSAINQTSNTFSARPPSARALQRPRSSIMLKTAESYS